MGKFVGRGVLGVLCAVFFAAGAADAHIFVLKPESMEAAEGSVLKVYAALAEPLIVPDMSKEMLEASGFEVVMSARANYKSGLVTELSAADFSPAHVKNPAETDKAKADADVASITVAEAGTVVLNGRLDMTKEGKRTVCFAKTFVNLSADGISTQRFAGDDAAEILFRSDVNSIAKGDAVDVQVLLKGKPLADAEVSATYDGAPALAADGPENEYITVKTDAEGGARFTMDSSNLWSVTIEYTDPEDSVRYRSSVLFDVK